MLWWSVLLPCLTPAPAPDALCAVGDLHGDVVHALEAFRLCGVVDAAGRWSGGPAVVVQTGDVLDRGNSSLPLLRWLWALRDEAAAAGGELVLLMGNHELLNMQGRTRYVDEDELHAFGGTAAWQHAMHPTQGELGQQLSALPGLAVRGVGACRTLFLHAGLRLSVGAAYGSVDALNAALTEQVRANRGALLDARTGPLWWRGYARPHAAGLDDETACAEARAAVASLGEGAVRMAVGHNIMPFVATACAGALHMIDVGMSTAYGGRPAAWRCEVDAEGAADVRALYVEGDEPPPDLCTACAEARRPPAHLLRGEDPHNDCANYCVARARQRGAGSASSWSRIIAAMSGSNQSPSGDVKTEF